MAEKYKKGSIYGRWDSEEDSTVISDLTEEDKKKQEAALKRLNKEVRNYINGNK